jgi:signal transduction histidine kinase
LAAVTNLLFLARNSDGLPESAGKYLETADLELRRMAHITGQALGFYRESTGRSLTSVNAVLDSALELLQGKIRAKRAVIEKHWDGDAQVVAVPGELRQVVSNLLVNSLEAIDQGGRIRLRTSANRRYVRVTVADNGKGIGASALRHVFDPFFTTKGTTGAGLGLWVSKEIVERHGGVIQMRSRAERGTVVSVLLRLSPELRQEIAA